MDLNKKYGIPVRRQAKSILENMRVNLQKIINHKIHHLQHKHIDMSKVDEMTQEDFVGMCPHQREKIR